MKIETKEKNYVVNVKRYGEGKIQNSKRCNFIAEHKEPEYYCDEITIGIKENNCTNLMRFSKEQIEDLTDFLQNIRSNWNKLMGIKVINEYGLSDCQKEICNKMGISYKIFAKNMKK